MKLRTKERLLTGGAVLLICAVGVVLPGCSTTQPRSVVLKTEGGVPITITQPRGTCTTDFDCEMHARSKTKPPHSEWTWKKVTGVVIGLVAAGYLYDRLDANGRDNRSSAVDIRTPNVTCADSGCAR